MPDVQAFVICREVRNRDGEIDLLGVAYEILVEEVPARIAFRSVAILAGLDPGVEYEVKLECFYNSAHPFSGFESERVRQVDKTEPVLITFSTDDFLILGYGKIDLRLCIGSDCERTYSLFVSKGGESHDDGRQSIPDGLR